MASATRLLPYLLGLSSATRVRSIVRAPTSAASTSAGNPLARFFARVRGVVAKLVELQAGDRVMRITLAFILMWLFSTPFRVLYNRLRAGRNKRMIEKYRDEEGIELPGQAALDSRTVREAIIQRDAAAEEERLKEEVSKRNIAVVLLKGPLGGDAQVVRACRVALEDAGLEYNETLVDGSTVKEWSPADKADAEALCGGIASCYHESKEDAAAAEKKEKDGDGGVEEGKGDSEALAPKSKTDAQQVPNPVESKAKTAAAGAFAAGGTRDQSGGAKTPPTPAAAAPVLVEEVGPQPKTAVFVVSWAGFGEARSKKLTGVPVTSSTDQADMKAQHGREISGPERVGGSVAPNGPYTPAAPSPELAYLERLHQRVVRHIEREGVRKDQDAQLVAVMHSHLEVVSELLASMTQDVPVPAATTSAGGAEGWDSQLGASGGAKDAQARSETEAVGSVGVSEHRGVAGSGRDREGERADSAGPRIARAGDTTGTRRSRCGQLAVDTGKVQASKAGSATGGGVLQGVAGGERSPLPDPHRSDFLLHGAARSHKDKGVSPTSSTKDLVRTSFLFN